MSKATKTITVKSTKYEGHDDSLAAAAEDIASQLGLETWEVEAADGEDDGEIVLTLPQAAAEAYETKRQGVREERGY